MSYIPGARRINCEKAVIIFVIRKSTVHIQRVMAASLV
jgi:hypothetical protein